MSDEVVLDVRGLSVYYGMRQAVVDATFPIKRNTVTAILGPSGCGKTTLMKAISRNLDITEGSRVSGQILLDGEDIFFLLS